MPAKLTKLDDALEVDLANCRGSDFQDALAKVKDIAGRKFHTETAVRDDGTEYTRKVWLLPLDPKAAEKAVYSMQPEVEPEVLEWIRHASASADAELVSTLPDDADDLLIPWATTRAEWQPDHVNGQPFVGLKPHQRALVSAIAAQPRVRAIVADDMGLGKTLQAISIAAEKMARDDLVAPIKPSLIVSPNSVKGVWSRELLRWLGDVPVQVIDATTAQARHNQLDRVIAERGWAIVNYEQLRTVKEKVTLKNGGSKTVERMKEPLFDATPWFAAVADEVHRAKNRKAAQTRGLYRIDAEIMLGLTGTPLMNSPDELWSILHWLFPKEYTSYWRFYETYVDYTEGYFGKVITGVKNPDALRFELQDRLFRRTKDQVLDLPEKLRVTVPVELGREQRKLYTEAERGLWLEVEKAVQEGDPQAARLAEAAAGGRNIYAIPNGAARTVRLRQVLSNPAILMWPTLHEMEQHMDDAVKVKSAKMDAAEDQVLDNKHKQHVVFSEFVLSCYIFAERLRRQGLVVETYTGKTTDQARTKLEDAFQRGEIDVLVGTIGAMREGITLTAADTQHWLELPWVPGWREQGEDRCHRIGQRNHVTLYNYEAIDSVDDGKIAPTNRLKERIVQSVVKKDQIKEETR